MRAVLIKDPCMSLQKRAIPDRKPALLNKPPEMWVQKQLGGNKGSTTPKRSRAIWHKMRATPKRSARISYQTRTTPK